MSVAKVYAKALFQAAEQAKDSVDGIEKQLDGFIRAIEASKDAKTALYGPILAGKEKASVVQEIAKRGNFGDLITRFLVLLARKGRLRALPMVREALVEARLAAEGGVMGSLVSADPLSDSDLEGLAKAFGRKLGKKVAFRVATDSSLLAGMKVTVNGVTYDGTLRSQIDRLRDRLSVGIPE